MKRNHVVLLKRLVAYGLAAHLSVQPAFAALTSISPFPLASSAGATILPNLLFTLDDSGSMSSDFIPDYVNDSQKCMTTSGNSTTCAVGDPPYASGGEFGFNGIAYDPNFTYLTGIDSTGKPKFNPPSGTITPTSTPRDAYAAVITNIDVTSAISDRKFCNSNGVCKRNGANDAGDVLPAGLVDAEGHTLAAGQFPYRTNASSASVVVSFGLPEMMSRGTFVRNTTGNFVGSPTSTVRATTIEAHGLTTSDRVFVTTATASLNATCAAVTSVTANTFNYVPGTTTTSANTTGSYRKCGPATFERTGNVVTATVPTGHFVVTGDVVSTFISTGNAMNVTNATITVTSPTTLTYTTGTSGTIAPTAGFGVRSGLYNVASTVAGPAIAYRITPVEYCTDANLTDCIEVIPPAAAPASHPFPAYVRFCRSQTEALAPGAVTAIATTPPTARCQAKFVNLTGKVYVWPRYGWFTRDTIKPTVASYGGRPNRVDCAGNLLGSPTQTCTYDEEIQNYAKWYAYYRTRMQMMKTAAGLSFFGFVSAPTATPPKPDQVRVGFITINAASGGTVSASEYLRIDNFNTTHASNFYTKFYQQTPGDLTPLREALSRAGWIFAGKLGTGLTAGIPAADDPIQASCQRNFSIFTTDGFWNGNAGQTVTGLTLGNVDNMDPLMVNPPYTDPFASRAAGTYDGNIAGASGTLADVALYYYMTDLRAAGAGPLTSPNTTPPGGDVSKNDVDAKAGDKDFVTHQHMVTFTVGLADGLMNYQPDYETATTGDFANIKKATAGACFWAAGTCNWPAPVANQPSALDDLWHAAVNGRGNYFLALNPRALASGLSEAISKTATRTASASAAATSSPNITATDNFAFSTTYQTNTWSGVVKAQQLDATTGAVQPTILWQANLELLKQVGPNAIDVTRSLWMFDDASATKLAKFDTTTLALPAHAATMALFKDKCLGAAPMSQCSPAVLSAPQMDQVNLGVDLVNFLRGQTGLERAPGNTNGLFRDRTEVDPVTGTTLQTVLGDIVDAEPAFVRLPPFKYEDTDATYALFKTAQAGRTGALYVAANDGYLHAFDSTTGAENWAYMPKFVMPGIYQIADTSYAGAHRFFLDATPLTADVFHAAASAWKTLIVGGAAGGARGYYALDITDSKNPKGLWEFCSDAALCPTTGTISHSDPDLGFTYGNPVIGKRKSDGKWVVVLTSGLNNVGPGSGQGFFFVLDAITGEVLAKVGTGVGDTITPSGLMKQGGFYPAGLKDATFTFVYAGDQLGNVWRMDMSVNPPVLLLLATLRDPSLGVQPITARPVVTTHTYNSVPYRIYYIGTGRYLGTSDLTNTQVQTIYGFKDKADNATTGYGDIRTANNLVPQTLSDSAVAGERSITTTPVAWDLKDGFIIDLKLDPPGAATERVVLDLRLELGTLVVSTNIPGASMCIPGGDSFVYNLDYRSGSYVKGFTVAGKRQGAFLVGVTPIQTADGSIRIVTTTSAGTLGTDKVKTDDDPKITRRFSYRER